MAEREWTGSVSNLPEGIRLLAQECQSKAWEYGTSPLSGYVQDIAASLAEWADAVEQLYARLDAGKPITNAQGVALARFLNRPPVSDRTGYATVMRGAMGLPEDYLYVRLSDGYEGGIAPNGDTST